MREGEIKKRPSILLIILLVIFAGPTVLAVVITPFWGVIKFFANGEIGSGLFCLVIIGLPVFIWLKVKKKKLKGRKIKTNPNTLFLQTVNIGNLILNNPFRGIFVLGAAGSGKSESLAVPLLDQFTENRYSGVVYDFKFPTLANDVESFLMAKRSEIRHYFLDFNNPIHSYRVNPLNPSYLPNTSYAREYAQAIIKNLLKESIKKPDFWVRSATDLLTACIWFLRVEHPEICDLPHVLAMITSNDRALLNILSTNVQTAQMTISIKGAMERGSEGQLSGVVGTLQGAVSQINTPELMYIFGGNDFSLDVNNPSNPSILTIGNNPTLTDTLSPLCALLLTVVTKMMNQPNKNASFVLLDEAPTVFVPNLEVLPNTGRSNKVCTVLMCQDLSQLTDSYGQEKADVLFSSCNSHFYGRVATSKTAEILSRQFGKSDKVYTTASRNKKTFEWATKGQSETVQERDVYKPSVFMNLQVGEFVGITVESNKSTFQARFKQTKKPQFSGLQRPNNNISMTGYYEQVRFDIDKLLEYEISQSVSMELGQRKDRDLYNLSY